MQTHLHGQALIVWNAYPDLKLFNGVLQCWGGSGSAGKDSHVFGPPRSGSGSISQRYGSESRAGSGSGSGSFPFLIKVLSKLK
jgi:hypothetical protein